MTHWKRAVIAASLVLWIAALIPASALGKKGGTHLPTRGRGTGNSCTTLATGAFHYTGTGIAAHIGRYSWDSVGQGGFTGVGEDYEGTGNFIVTVADGAEFFGTFTFVSEDAALPVHHDTAYLTITGGTGRLTGITGEITEASTLSTYFYDGVTACASTEGTISGWVNLNK